MSKEEDICEESPFLTELLSNGLVRDATHGRRGRFCVWTRNLDWNDCWSILSPKKPSADSAASSAYMPPFLPRRRQDSFRRSRQPVIGTFSSYSSSSCCYCLLLSSLASPVCGGVVNTVSSVSPQSSAGCHGSR